jgi:polysaccharide pyruvyl transferase WcaK-like protein
MVLAGMAALPLAAQKRRTILLRTAWQRRNIGDVCFTPAMLSAIEEYLPGTRVICWMASNHEDVNAMVRRAHPNAELLHASFGAEGRPMDPSLEKAFGEADLFLFNSGPIYSYGLHEVYDWNRSMGNALFAMYAKQRGVPYGMYGQSYDRFAWPSPLLFNRVLSEAAFVYPRESDSWQHLKDLGVKPPVLEVGPDIAFHFRLRNDGPARSFLSAKGLESGKFLVTMAHYATMDRPGVKDHGASHLEKQRAVLQRWIRETGMPVLVVAEDDREVAFGKQWLIDPMPAEIQRKMLLRDGSFWLPDEALSLYLHSHCLFTAEPHSLIFSLGNGIPGIHIYDPAFGRKAQMFADFGLREWAFDLRQTQASTMGDYLLAIHRDRTLALRRVEKSMDRVKARMADAFAAIGKAMKA